VRTEIARSAMIPLVRTSLVYTHIHLGNNAMTVAKTRTFRSGNSEAIRLPKDVAFGKDLELVIVRSGDVLTLYPATTSIPEMIARLEALPVPPSIEDRDDEELPERAGL
jgi:antitoxin VapB